MATITVLPILPEVPQTFWSRIVAVAKRVVEAVMNDPCIGCLTCQDAEAIAYARHDNAIRASIRNDLRARGRYTLGGCVQTAIDDIFDDAEYDMQNVEQRRNKELLEALRAGPKRTLAEWDALFANIGIDPFDMEVSHKVHRQAQIVPRFASSMAVYLRTKLGRMSKSEANLLLAEREYLRVCRKLNVRGVDIVSHQQHVLNAVFTETLLDDIGLARTRIPRWLRWTTVDSSTAAQPLAI